MLEEQPLPFLYVIIALSLSWHSSQSLHLQNEIAYEAAHFQQAI